MHMIRDTLLIILGCFLIALLLTWAMFSYQKAHPCLQSHQEMVHTDAYTSMWYTGKVWMPYYHEAEDNLETICDLRK